MMLAISTVFVLRVVVAWVFLKPNWTPICLVMFQVTVVVDFHPCFRSAKAMNCFLKPLEAFSSEPK